MKSPKHFTIFSHGFGTRKDARGFFPEIASAINGSPILFDYNIIDEQNNTLTVRTLTQQSKILEKIIQETRQSNLHTTIDLICHSQGCLVAAILNPTNIRKTIFLAPPLEPGSSASLSHFAKRPGSEINMNGVSRLVRRDGSATLVPSEFWKERENILPTDIYNKFAEKTELIIIKANQDDVLNNVNLDELDPRIQILSLDGDHNFSGNERDPLLDALRSLQL